MDRKIAVAIGTIVLIIAAGIFMLFYSGGADKQSNTENAVAAGQPKAVETPAVENPAASPLGTERPTTRDARGAAVSGPAVRPANTP